MKRITKTLATVTAAAALSFTSVSCTGYASPEANAAATGGLIGAGAGAVLADDSLEGAAIGGALGAGAGYLYGRSRHRGHYHRY